MSSAAMETTLDLQAAHAMAPEAKLVLEQVNLPAEHWTRHSHQHHRRASAAPERSGSERSGSGRTVSEADVMGTSEAAPLLAGVVALADQVAGKRLGLITPAIYQLAAQKNPGIVDIVTGQNGVDGYRATTGYDLASGWGTIDAAKLVPALVNAMR